MNDSKVIVALDYDDIDLARNFVSQVHPDLCRLKVGKQMFVQYGPAWIEELQKQGFDIFLDLKFHDIPSTVAKACVSAAKLGVWMCNMHACGGVAMMLAAREAVDRLNLARSPLLIGVTVLTSMQQYDFSHAGFTSSIETAVNSYATDVFNAGLDGVVCSALEANKLEQRFGERFLKVTPGIRFDQDNKDDQSRIMTPELALQQGANYLVMGRGITQASDPLRRLQVINSY